jgi:heme-degrading monooxygenase HmoA
MVTTVSQVTLKDGAASTWDQVMQERLEAVRALPGWVSGQVLKPLDDDGKRMVVGTWSSPSFQTTRKQLDELEATAHEQWWHEVTVAAQR